MTERVNRLTATPAAKITVWVEPNRLWLSVAKPTENPDASRGAEWARMSEKEWRQVRDCIDDYFAAMKDDNDKRPRVADTTGGTWPERARASMTTPDITPPDVGGDDGARRAELMHDLFMLADHLEETPGDELWTLLTMNERVSDGLMAHLAHESVYGRVFTAVGVGLAFLDHCGQKHGGHGET